MDVIKFSIFKGKYFLPIKSKQISNKEENYALKPLIKPDFHSRTTNSLFFLKRHNFKCLKYKTTLGIFISNEMKYFKYLKYVMKSPHYLFKTFSAKPEEGQV